MVIRGTIPVRGYHGGVQSLRREVLINRERAHPFERYLLELGDSLVIKDTRGGCFGPPKERAMGRW